MAIPQELLDILHRIIHSSSAAEIEKAALHEAVKDLESVDTPAKEKG
jgi:hypothetical protein